MAKQKEIGELAQMSGDEKMGLLKKLLISLDDNRGCLRAHDPDSVFNLVQH